MDFSVVLVLVLTIFVGYCYSLSQLIELVPDDEELAEIAKSTLRVPPALPSSASAGSKPASSAGSRTSPRSSRSGSAANSAPGSAPGSRRGSPHSSKGVE